MTTSTYCLYVGIDYTYIHIHALAQGIKSFLSSQVWFQAVCMYIYKYMYVCISSMYVLLFVVVVSGYLFYTKCFSRLFTFLIINLL